MEIQKGQRIKGLRISWLSGNGDFQRGTIVRKFRGYGRREFLEVRADADLYPAGTYDDGLRHVLAQRAQVLR